MTLVCGSYTFAVHQHVVAIRGGSKIRTRIEEDRAAGDTPCLDLSDYPIQSVVETMYYLYTGSESYPEVVPAESQMHLVESLAPWPVGVKNYQQTVPRVFLDYLELCVLALDLGVSGLVDEAMSRLYEYASHFRKKKTLLASQVFFSHVIQRVWTHVQLGSHLREFLLSQLKYEEGVYSGSLTDSLQASLRHVPGFIADWDASISVDPKDGWDCGNVHYHHHSRGGVFGALRSCNCGCSRPACIICECCIQRTTAVSCLLCERLCTLKLWPPGETHSWEDSVYTPPPIPSLPSHLTVDAAGRFHLEQLCDSVHCCGPHV
jgi:hypothetical protein